MFRALLNLPAGYRLLASAFGSDKVYRGLVEESGYTPGTRTLDVGCGTGDLAKYIKGEDYVGIDLSAEYIADASARWRAEFYVMSATDIDKLPSCSFDLALICGVLHHLDDLSVARTLAALREVVKPTGRVFILEAVWPSNSMDLIGYFIRRLDRGDFVRTAAEWRSLLCDDWSIERDAVIRNGIIEYYQCTLK